MISRKDAVGRLRYKGFERVLGTFTGLGLSGFRLELV